MQVGHVQIEAPTKLVQGNQWQFLRKENTQELCVPLKILIITTDSGQ